MEMTCESVEEVEATSAYCEDTDAEVEQPLLLCIVEVMSLSTNGDSNERRSSLEFDSANFMSAETQRPFSVSMSGSRLRREKRSTDCHVVLERLPE